MNPELELLANKIAKLAELTVFLRAENAELRRDIVALTEENGAMHLRMGEAFTRVAALLAQLPAESEIGEEST